MRWLVGDLQGCVEPFDRLLRAIDYDASRDELWVLGDLVNRGPESAATLRLWRDIGGRAILGNHDVYALLTASGIWKRKQDTLDDLFTAKDYHELLALLRGLPVLVQLSDEVWIVHAGIHPAWNDLKKIRQRLDALPLDDHRLTDPDIQFATRVRCCDASGNIMKGSGPPSDCVPPYKPWDDIYRGKATIVHGHWARRGYYRGERTIGLDSGCVYGGPLTAWCLEEDRIVQVPGQKQ